MKRNTLLEYCTTLPLQRIAEHARWKLGEWCLVSVRENTFISPERQSYYDRDPDPRKTALARASSIYKRQTSPLIREGAPQKQDRNCQTVIKSGHRHQSLLTDRQSVAMWLWRRSSWKGATVQRGLEHRSRGIAVVRNSYQETYNEDTAG
jgi:hypothetical protein